MYVRIGWKNRTTGVAKAFHFDVNLWCVPVAVAKLDFSLHKVQREIPLTGCLQTRQGNVRKVAGEVIGCQQITFSEPNLNISELGSSHPKNLLLMRHITALFISLWCYAFVISANQLRMTVLSCSSSLCSDRSLEESPGESPHRICVFVITLSFGLFLQIVDLCGVCFRFFADCIRLCFVVLLVFLYHFVLVCFVLVGFS